MEKNDVKASQDTIFLATIADRLGAIMAWAIGTERPDILVTDLIGESYESPNQTQSSNIMTFDSPEDFMRARYGE